MFTLCTYQAQVKNVCLLLEIIIAFRNIDLKFCLVYMGSVEEF